MERNMSDDTNLPEPAHGSPGGGQLTHVGEHGAVDPHDDPFANPGLPEHLPRLTDIDEKAARRAERQVATLFTISALATIGFMVSYTFIPRYDTLRVFPFGKVSASNFALGLCLGIALFCIGAGAIHWARRLMTDVEIAQERHPLRSDDESRAGAIADWQQGVEESGFGRRSLIRRSMMGALGVLPLSGLWILRDLGPMPKKQLRTTFWGNKPNTRLINENDGLPVKASDIPVGSLLSILPEGLTEDNPNYDDELTKAAVMVVRLDPNDIKSSKEQDWGYQGIVAYSKICTHVGCPLGLYEQQTHHMLCPCHQSTFDLADDGKVLFGPAARSLPQLRITVDSQGYLVAPGDFGQPVGPSFWERG
jgi:ubiquinol-cytochrome c reductase iron-sulfur subunit